MSRTSRLEEAATRIQSPDDAAIGQLGRNAAGVAGGTGSVDIPEPVEMMGLLWDRKDGRWDCGSPIGTALALEMAAQA